MAIPMMVFRTPTTGEALSLVLDRVNTQFVSSFDIGTKAYTYDPVTGDLTTVTWTLSLPLAGGATMTVTLVKTYTWVAGQLTAETDWVGP